MIMFTYAYHVIKREETLVLSNSRAAISEIQYQVQDSVTVTVSKIDSRKSIRYLEIT